MLYAKPGEHPTAVAMLSIVTLRSALINYFTCCSVDFVAIKTGRPLRSSSTIWNGLAKNSLPICTLVYVPFPSLDKKNQVTLL
ncbi:hypothetical protein TNCT_421061 [Trichonephila clavata]|uniref:Uncharacterized protein n=1 Tax=Trichonephila clavata TaxID=2740835 RepID=A0A8X6GJ26_TRICU|nr:hypothetical protein TNCT_421061 [Trichonephila clavata]